MARFRRTEDDDVSLFPFLSVIAAVIGVLTLMIAAVTLGQMNQDDVKEAVKNAIEMEDIQQQAAVSENAIQELKIQLEQQQADCETGTLHQHPDQEGKTEESKYLQVIGKQKFHLAKEQPGTDILGMDQPEYGANNKYQ